MNCRRAIRPLALVLVAMAASLVACGRDDTASIGMNNDALSGTVRNPPLQVATVQLPNVAESGAPMAMQAPSGQLLLVYFGYTSCPDICPTTMSDISVALNDLADSLAERVTVAMATVDPERDTPDKLAEYLRHFFSRSIPLRTDDPAALRSATDAFGVKFEVAQHEAGAAYAVAHSAMTYVVDDTGSVVVEWPFGFESADMAHDITHLLNKENP